MEAELTETLAKLRMAVGYLGEREQFGWWQSSFFTQGATAFLSPLFPRTMTLAQCNGVTQAAALVHDERIGVGDVYHLFRLPEDIEQALHQALQDPAFTERLQQITTDRETAVESLRKQMVAHTIKGVGPVRVGNIQALRDIDAWKKAAGAYLLAFDHSAPIFPYFTDIV